MNERVNNDRAVLVGIGLPIVLLCSVSISFADELLGISPSPVKVDTVSSSGELGRLESFSLDSGLVLTKANGEQVRRPAADVVRIESVGPVFEPWANRVRVSLTNGDLIIGVLRDGEPDYVSVYTSVLGLLSIPLERIVSIELPGKHGDKLNEFLRRDKLLEDKVLLANGDVVGGFLVSVSEATLELERGNSVQRIEISRIAAIRLSNTPEPKQSGLRAVLHFIRGGRATATGFVFANGEAGADLEYKKQVEIDPETIAAIDVAGGRWEWLSDKTPVSYTHTPMLSLSWPARNDTNVLGELMSVDGFVFKKGLGLHSKSRIVYVLDGRYTEFTSVIGLDDQAGPWANVDVKVIADDKLLYERCGLTLQDVIKEIRLNITDAKRLELIVDFGRNGDLQDRFNFARAALIK